MQTPLIEGRIQSHEQSISPAIGQGAEAAVSTVDRRSAQYLIELETAAGAVILPIHEEETIRPEGEVVQMKPLQRLEHGDIREVGKFFGIGRFAISGLSEEDTKYDERYLLPSATFFNTRIAPFSNHLRLRTSPFITKPDETNLYQTPLEFYLTDWAMGYMSKLPKQFTQGNVHDYNAHVVNVITHGDAAIQAYSELTRKFLQNQGLDLPNPGEYDLWQQTELTDFADQFAESPQRDDWKAFARIIDLITTYGADALGPKYGGWFSKCIEGLHQLTQDPGEDYHQEEFEASMQLLLDSYANRDVLRAVQQAAASAEPTDPILHIPAAS